jgi:citrate lyase subunit beta / citryl-CoA lyase
MSGSTQPLRARRSELAVPGSDARMIQKAFASDADLVFIDLEDAVAVDHKDHARRTAIEALNRIDTHGKSRAVRVNGLDTQWCLDDVVDVVTEAGSAVDVLIVPKVREAREVWWLDQLLHMLERKVGVSSPIGLEVLIEETDGLVNVAAIARSSPRLEALIFGAGDFSASQRARVDDALRQPTYPGDIWHYVRAAIVVAARAAGIDAIDAPYPRFKDASGYEAACQEAASLGFDGKWAIHPAQAPIANEVFAPSPDEIAWARRVVDAFADAEARGSAATAIDGLLVDTGSVRIAQVALERAALVARGGD